MKTMDKGMEIKVSETSNFSITKEDEVEANSSNSFWECYSELAKLSTSNNEQKNLHNANEVKLNSFLEKPLIKRMQCPLA